MKNWTFSIDDREFFSENAEDGDEELAQDVPEFGYFQLEPPE